MYRILPDETAAHEQQYRQRNDCPRRESSCNYIPAAVAKPHIRSPRLKAGPLDQKEHR